MDARSIEFKRLWGIFAQRAIMPDPANPSGNARKNDPASRISGPACFDWPLAKEAEALLRERLEVFRLRNGFVRDLAQRLRNETATDLFEWIDHFSLPAENEPALSSAGFKRDEHAEVTAGAAVYEHPRATLPRVLLRPSRGLELIGIALRPERLADFVARNNLAVEPEGEPYSRYRRVIVNREDGTQVEAVERRAYRGFVPAPLRPGEAEALLKAEELWRTRPRLFPDDAAGFRCAREVLHRVLDLVGPDVACHFFFASERAYWENRNRAARVQKFRQDRVGLGWGNHDHHTFRCSRAHFVELIEFLLRLGFNKRERYYAGAEAGWGAQILEHPATGIVVFADVDLMPDETQIDFSSTRLAPAPRLGTVGLWVGLHGESLLEAGMHHLEARFDFELLRQQLQDSGVGTMKPFSDFPFLRQAFTEGERWPVRRERAQRLLAAGLLSREQFDKFLAEGALGSHLENLQRHAGFKGFNQKSVSAIIAATDPRQQHFPRVPAAA